MLSKAAGMPSRPIRSVTRAPQVQAARADVLGEDREVPGRVGVAVDAAGEGAAPVEELQGVEGDLLVLAADADDRGAAAAAGRLPGGADGGGAADALDGDVRALPAGEARGSRLAVVSEATTYSVAPAARASSSFSGETSTATIVDGARDPGRLEGGEADPADAEDGDRLALRGPAREWWTAP